MRLRRPAAVTAALLLSGAAVLPADSAVADPGQDERFLALLDQQRTPAVENVPELVDAAHRACAKLDGGMSFNDLLDHMVNQSYEMKPAERQNSTLATSAIARFITAAVTVYCPQNQDKLP